MNPQPEFGLEPAVDGLFARVAARVEDALRHVVRSGELAGEVRP